MRTSRLMILAILLPLAGLGAAKTCAKALQEGDIMSMGRRRTALIRKESNPQHFWITVSYNALIAVGLFGGSTALVISAIRGGKQKPSKALEPGNTGRHR